MFGKFQSHSVYLFRILLTVSVLCVAICGGAAAGNDFDNLSEVKALQREMPKDIAVFISRTAECQHWSGEEPYDKERAEFIRNAMLKAGCSKVDAEEIRLRQKYRKNPKIIDTIKKAKNLMM
jgi:hypothetical protein